jgi:hypothetical protein
MKTKKNFYAAFTKVTGGDAEGEKELNRIANMGICVEIEKMVIKRGFTLMVHPIREFYKEYGGDLSLPVFMENLSSLIREMTANRKPEKDGGVGSRAFLSTRYDDF